jgi:hypothetical protein
VPNKNGTGAFTIIAGEPIYFTGCGGLPLWQAGSRPRENAGGGARGSWIGKNEGLVSGFLMGFRFFL